VAVIRAAQAGRGLALARWSLVSGEIAEGGLVIASPKIIPMAHGYYFVCPASYLGVEKVAAFREWLLQQAPSSGRPPSSSLAAPLGPAEACARGSGCRFFSTVCGDVQPHPSPIPRGGTHYSSHCSWYRSGR
jgi:LysR substrate binding domain